MIHHLLHPLARLAVAVLVVAAVVSASIALAGHDGGTLDPASVDEFVTGYLDRTGLPGAAVAVTRGTEVVHVAGYGRDSAGAPVTARTRLPIASVSKPFTALAVMQLVERGDIDLDAPVREYLPAFRVNDRRGAQITVRHLLSHRSGISDLTFPEKRRPQPDSLATAVTRLRSADLASAPGSASHYHNPNYQVAARLVEVVGGEPFAAYLDRQVFGPLGMQASTTVGDLRDARDVADGHISVFGQALALPEPHWFLDGGSGVVTNAEDLARSLIMFGNGGRAADGTRIVSAAGLEELQTPAVPGEDRGLGWDVDVTDDGPRQIGHAGWMFTFTADMVLVPESRHGIAVVANRGLRLAPADAEAIAQGLVAISRGAAPDPPAPIGLVVDVVLGTVTSVIGALGVRALVRSQSWARRRSGRSVWRGLLRSAPWLVPLALLAGLRSGMSLVAGGRDGTWLQVVYISPALVLCLTVAATVGIAVVGLRTVRLSRLRRQGATGAGVMGSATRAADQEPR
jgi:CubicO group peptidase (beta-lactamase class C family)